MHIRTGHFLVISDTVICYIYDIVNHSFIGFVTSARDWLIGLWMGDDGISCQVHNGNGRTLLFSLLAFPGMTLCAGSSGGSLHFLLYGKIVGFGSATLGPSPTQWFEQMRVWRVTSKFSRLTKRSQIRRSLSFTGKGKKNTSFIHGYLSSFFFFSAAE